MCSKVVIYWFVHMHTQQKVHQFNYYIYNQLNALLL
jgi:hypothetical protein